MLKKTTFCILVFGLFLGSGDLFAQMDQFFAAPPKGGIVKLPEDVDLGLRNAAELTDDELSWAFMESSSTVEEKGAAYCLACTNRDCAHTCYWIPVGSYMNAPPGTVFTSFETGGTMTFVSTCNDLNGTAPCQLFKFESAIPHPYACVNSDRFFLLSVGCI